MAGTDSRLTIVEQSLDQVGVFQSKKVIVAGNDHFSNQVASLFKQRGSEVFLFGGKASKTAVNTVNTRKSETFSLDIFALRKESDLIQNCELIIVLSCDKAILEELLIVASPFSDIIIIGPIEGVLEDLDLYGTVHYKNLSLIFLPFGASHIPMKQDAV